MHFKALLAALLLSALLPVAHAEEEEAPPSQAQYVELNRPLSAPLAVVHAFSTSRPMWPCAPTIRQRSRSCTTTTR